jgi:hypothetical protein
MGSFLVIVLAPHFREEGHSERDASFIDTGSDTNYFFGVAFLPVCGQFLRCPQLARVRVDAPRFAGPLKDLIGLISGDLSDGFIGQIVVVVHV